MGRTQTENLMQGHQQQACEERADVLHNALCDAHAARDQLQQRLAQAAELNSDLAGALSQAREENANLQHSLRLLRQTTDEAHRLHAENAELRHLLHVVTTAGRRGENRAGPTTPAPWATVGSLAYLPGTRGPRIGVGVCATVPSHACAEFHAGRGGRQFLGQWKHDKLGAWVPRQLLALGTDLLRRLAPEPSWADLADFLLLVHKVYKAQETRGLLRQQASFDVNLKRAQRAVSHARPTALVLQRQRIAHLQRLVKQRAGTCRGSSKAARRCLRTAVEKSLHLARQVDSTKAESLERARELEDLVAHLDQATSEVQAWQDAAERAAAGEEQALVALRDSRLRVRLLTEQLAQEEDNSSASSSADVAFQEGATKQARRDVACLQRAEQGVAEACAQHRTRLSLLVASGSPLRAEMLSAEAALAASLKSYLSDCIHQVQASSSSSSSRRRRESEDHAPADLAEAWERIRLRERCGVTSATPDQATIPARSASGLPRARTAPSRLPKASAALRRTSSSSTSSSLTSQEVPAVRPVRHSSVLFHQKRALQRFMSTGGSFPSWAPAPTPANSKTM